VKFYAEKKISFSHLSGCFTTRKLLLEGNPCVLEPKLATAVKPSNSREGEFTTNKCNFSPLRLAASLCRVNDVVTSIIKSHFMIAMQFILLLSLSLSLSLSLCLSAKLSIFKAYKLQEYRPPFPSPVLLHNRARKSIHGVGSSLIAIITPLSDSPSPR